MYMCLYVYVYVFSVEISTLRRPGPKLCCYATGGGGGGRNSYFSKFQCPFLGTLYTGGGTQWCIWKVASSIPDYIILSAALWP